MVLGSIFTTQQSDGELAEVEILDGQQRITTIILLLRQIYLIKFSESDFKSSLSWSSNNENENETKFEELDDEFEKHREAIYECLIYISGRRREKIPKFYTDESIRTLFSKLFEDFTSINNDSYSDRNQLLAEDESDFLTTKNVNENIETIDAQLNEVLFKRMDMKD